MVKICDAYGDLRPFVIVNNWLFIKNLALKFADSLILIQIDRMFESLQQNRRVISSQRRKNLLNGLKKRSSLVYKRVRVEKSVLDGVSKKRMQGL